MLKLIIVTPTRRVIGPISVSSVTLPSSKGEVTILPGHARYLSTMDTGVLKFDSSSGKSEVAAVSTGFFEVDQDEVKVLAETLELSKEIDLDRAKRAQEKAEESLKAKELFEEDMVKWRRKWERAQIRQQVAAYLLPPH